MAHYPATLYGHVVVTIEIFSGMIWFAVITGLIFVRFSRPTARVLFSKNILIGNHQGPADGDVSRRQSVDHLLWSTRSFASPFPATNTCSKAKRSAGSTPSKFIPDMTRFLPRSDSSAPSDEESPLFGGNDGVARRMRRLLSRLRHPIETVMAAPVQSQQDYSYDDIRWGERFVDIYEQRDDGKLQVDYGRIHDTEPIPKAEDRSGKQKTSKARG
jgi:inward rectifier potassium channel